MTTQPRKPEPDGARRTTATRHDTAPERERYAKAAQKAGRDPLLAVRSSELIAHMTLGRTAASSLALVDGFIAELGAIPASDALARARLVGEWETRLREAVGHVDPSDMPPLMWESDE